MIVLEKLVDGYYFHGRFGLIRAEREFGPCVADESKVILTLGVSKCGELVILSTDKMAVLVNGKEAN